MKTENSYLCITLSIVVEKFIKFLYDVGDVLNPNEGTPEPIHDNLFWD